MSTWPRRAAPKRRPTRHPQGLGETASDPVLAPQLLPRRPREAWLALAVLVATFTVVAYVLVTTTTRFVDADIEARIVYMVVGAAGVAVLMLFGVSMLAHVLPTALGMRRR